MKRVTFLFLIVVLTVSIFAVVVKNTIDNSPPASHPFTTVRIGDPNSQPPPIIIPPTGIPPDSCSHHHVDGCTHDGDHDDLDRHDEQDDQGENECSAEDEWSF